MNDTAVVPSAVSAGRTSSLQGDAESLYRLHHVRLVWAVRASVKAPTETIEDACSFAWLQLMRTEPEGGPKLFAWLRTVAIHEAIRLAKRDAHFGNNDAEQNVDARLIDLNTAVEARETARAIGSLRERQRRILLLHLAGYSYKEIAEHTGDTVRTVERQLLRGRQRLRGFAA